MNKRSLGALMALNLVLLVSLMVVHFAGQPAAGQGFATGRGEYIMIAGQTRGRENQNVVYIMELKSARMAAVIFRSADRVIELVNLRDIGADVSGATGGR